MNIEFYISYLLSTPTELILGCVLKKVSHVQEDKTELEKTFIHPGVFIVAGGNAAKLFCPAQ